MKTTILSSLSSLFLVLLSFNLSAQGVSVAGSVKDQNSHEALINVTVTIAPVADTTAAQGTISDIDGNYEFTQVTPGNYLLRVSSVGYSTSAETITVGNDSLTVVNITLEPGKNQLSNVTVNGVAIRAQQTGDTSTFNADAFKTNPDATAEDLVTKMPGVTSENGTVKVNGEQVKQVYVDGKPFFGDDPNAAMKNLPAEIIEKVQVFDNQSDQSKFTGFDDGNSSKTLNFITRRGRNNGVFGKVSLGAGSDETFDNNRYSGTANLNFFNGDRRISLVGMANNVNVQNFSSEDLLGVTSSGGSRGGGRGGGGFGGPGGGGYGGGGDAASNFQVNQSGGINLTQAAGINYTDQWGKKLKVTGSYFFNRSENTTVTSLQRNYITGNNDSALVYNENSTSNSTNYNHRFNLRLEYTIDSNNALILNPSLKYQGNQTTKDLTGITSLGGDIEEGSVFNHSLANSNGYNFNNNLTFRHSFQKKGRTISFSGNTGYNSKTGDGTLYSLNQFNGGDTATVDQRYDLNSDGLNLSGNITYTEPLNLKSQLMVTYNPSYSKNNSDRETFNRDGGLGTEYTDLDTGLTNKYNNTYTTQRGGLGYRYNDSVNNFFVNVNVQDAQLKGEQLYPTSFTVDKHFFNVLPMAMWNIKFSRNENLRLFYRTNNNAPSISQLQNIIDNSNPLFLRTGNVDLRQDYTHSINARYGRTNAKGHSLFLFGNASFVNDYIGNETIIASQDTLVGDIFLNRGTQLSRPVNLDGDWNARAFITYGLPLKSLKLNLNFNGGYTYSKVPGLINGHENFSSTSAINGGLVISSNISEDIDFTLSYSGAYNMTKNTLQTQSDFNYYSQTTSLRFNYIYQKNLVFNTNLAHTMYSGLGEGYDQSFLLWNASVGYKFLKDRSLMLDLYAFDILKANNAISRTITDTYIEDSRSNVLQRYLMLRLTWTIRKFKGGTTMPTGDDDQRRRDFGPGMGPGGPGGPPPGGGGGGGRRD